MTFAAAAILKATLALLLALGAAAIFRRAAAATRYAILLAGQIAALTMPMLAFVVPQVDVEITPVTLPRATQATRPVAQSDTPTPTAPEPSTAPRDVVAIVWLLGFAAVASRHIVAFVRANAVVRRAARFGEVLMSGEVDQPVTLGARVVLPPAARHWDEARMPADGHKVATRSPPAGHPRGRPRASHHTHRACRRDRHGHRLCAASGRAHAARQ